MMKNHVHFSPVVSQLRYPQGYPYSSTGANVNNGDNNSTSSPFHNFEDELIQKVTVQVQQVEAPQIQKIQVSIPPTPPKNLEESYCFKEGLFANQLRILSERQPPIKMEEDSEKINNYQSALINRGGGVLEGEELVNLRKNRNLNTVGSLEYLSAGEGKPGGLSDAVNETTTTGKAKVNKRFATISGGISSGVNDVDNCGVNGDYNNKGDRKKNRNSFLRWITFGKLGGEQKSKLNGATNSGKISSQQKRSSCPPLGHPLLLTGGIEDVGGRENLTNDRNFWREKSNGEREQVISLEVEKVTPTAIKPVLTPSPPKIDVLPPKPLRHPLKKVPLPVPPPLLRRTHSSSISSCGGNTDTEDDEFSVNFERIIEGIFDSTDNPPSYLSSYPSPPPKRINGKMTSTTPTFSDYTITTNSSLDEAGILASMEQKAVPLSTSSEDIPDGTVIKNIPSILTASNSPPKQKSATIPVVGKPPKPPSSVSANKFYGTRPSIHHHRYHHLHSTPPDSSRLPEAMLELAAKLVSFRAELHRSREQLASATLDSLHLSTASTPWPTGIDPAARRSLPPSSRNPSSAPPNCSPTTPRVGVVAPSDDDPVEEVATGSGGAVRNTIKSGNYYSPNFGGGLPPSSLSHQGSSVEAQVLKEWNNRLSRAKETFTKRGTIGGKFPPSSYYYGDWDPSNSSSPPPLLETDLDDGGNALGEGENLWRGKGGGVVPQKTDRNKQRVIIPKKGRNSLSLQNLNSFGGEGGVGGDLVNSGGEVDSARALEDLETFGGIEMATLKPTEAGGDGKEDRSRSMEFLMDSEKAAHLRPPENTLQKQTGGVSGERRMSEHELRIQRSLQKLNVPDWYKNYTPSNPSSAANTPSKSRTGDFGGSGTGLAGGWPGLSSSKTNSLTSLQSAGRYTGAKSGFGAYSSGRGVRPGGSATGGRSSRESLMSPSSTASASPSPNFERSSFTYGMPYALTRFAAARMSCGASPASLSPSPSPVGGVALSSTSTPVSSGPAARYHGYQKTPYLGWRSQERLSSKSLYRSPAERLAQDLIAQQKAKQSPLVTPQTPQAPVLQSPASSVPTPQHHYHHQLHQSSSSSTPTTIIQVESPSQYCPPPEIEVNRISPTKSAVTSATASDLSLNNSEESNSHKLNRVRSSIKEVSNAIVDYVNETKPLDDGMNGRASPRRGFVWLESSFVGTKPIDSPSTPDTPSTFIGRGAAAKAAGTSHFRFDTHELPSSGAATSGGAGGERRGERGGEESTSSTSHYTTYISRNEQMEERSASSSVSSPTLEDILDSLLALRRPNKKFRSKHSPKGNEATSPVPPTTTSTSVTSSSTATSKPSLASLAGGGSAEDDPSSSQHYYYHSYSASSATPPPTTAATFGSSYDRPTVTSSPSKTGGGASTSSYQYQYPSASSYDQPPSSTTTSEIYSSTGASSGERGGGGDASFLRKNPPSSTSSSYRSYQSDWQERMNQPPPDSTFSYGGESTSTFTSISSRYSSSSTTGGGAGADAISSPGGASSPAISSLHSTPTHQPYNRQSSSTSGTTTSGGAVKDSSSSPYYYSSSAHSSPAKSILGGGGGDRTSNLIGGDTDSNELLYHTRRSTSGGGGATSKDPEEEDELAFGNPTEILRSMIANNNSSGATPTGGTTVAPLQGGVIVNPLTGLSEYSNPPTPARHRRVSFDLDFSDKEEKSSSRSRNKEENVGGTIQCRNTKCAKTATGLEARREFKVCHNCNAYYCSRECRRAHWDKHKKTCMQSRVGAICKQIISHVKDDSYVMNQLSTTAKRGFLAKGRGCVKLFFNSPDRAERFLTGGLPELPEPLYIPHSDMLPEEMGAQTFSELSDQCRGYNPETRFVLYACVCVVNEVPTYGAVKWERELISRSSKLRLLLPRHFFEENQRHHHAPANPAHHLLTSGIPPPATSPGGEVTSTTNGGDHPASSSPSHHPHVPLYDTVPQSTSGGDEVPPPLPPPHATPPSAENDTLILRSVPPPSSHQLSCAEHKRLREVSFANIQKHLLLRGVDIKRSYPDIFTKLCRYVEHDEPFLPVTIYPRNSDTGRQFVCVIMPECSDASCQGHTSQQNQEATIAAAVASAAAFTTSLAALGGVGIGDGGGRSTLQRVETINISEPGDLEDEEGIDLT